jgi:translation initiation factor IF-2
MAKIRVTDLARMMQIPEQDLVFKLRSLGVRIEGDDAGIEAEALQAILQGRKLTSPREVIMDDSAPAAPARRAAAPPVATATPTARRSGANPLKPARPRTIIQKVEPRILTIPASQIDRPVLAHDAPPPPPAFAPAPQMAAPAESPVAETERLAPPPSTPPPVIAPTIASASPASAAPATPASAAPPRRGAILIHRPTEPYRPPAPTGRPRPGGPGGAPGRPSGPGSYRPAGAPGRPSGPSRPGGPPGRPGGPPGRPGMGRPSGPGRPGGYRPGSPPPPPAPGVGRGPRKADSPAERDKNKTKKGRKTLLLPQTDENALRQLRGSLLEIEDVVDSAVIPTGSAGRRRRRADEEDHADARASIHSTRTAADGPVVVSEGMAVREFAEKLGVRVKDLIKLLFDHGIFVNINHVIEPELGLQLAKLLGLEAKVMTFEEEVQASHLVEKDQADAGGPLVPRAPVVTIMGHVDHGKTSLLDKIRSSKITESEFGGITQHIGAYHVDVKNRQIVFLDTPGHEAFTLMRARGARATDVVILVVAADDGVMPQTLEAIDHARAANVPIIVALNKIDKPNANPDRVKQQLADKGLLPEDWGGQTVVAPVSAVRGDGIDELLEMVLLTSDLLELKANPDRPAQGVVLEARKETGRGVVATVLVQNGTLHVGDIFVSGSTWGRARSMNDDRGHRAQATGPATAAEVTGFQDVPEAGDSFQAVGDEQKARSIVEFRQQEKRKRDLLPSAGRNTLEQLFNQIQQGEVKELGIVLKADVQGSVEVLRDAIEKASTTKVHVKVLHSAVGAVSTNDVLLAAASKAIIVGFNIRPEKNAAELAEKEQVEIRLHTIIYELLDELKKAMTGLLDPTFKEVQRGRAEVRDTFKVPKIGTIAGCHVIEGVIPRTAGVRLVRDSKVVYEGKISSLRRFKDDASEVRAGFDCGIGLERFQDIKPGDIIEAFAKEEVAAVLS